MAKPRVLVTGASGLIGRLTIAGLGHKYAFTGLCRRPAEGIPCLQADIVDAAAIRPAFQGMDMVIHLGAVLDTDRPQLIRHFPGYLSQADAVQFIDKCLSAPPSLRHGVFDAISENRYRWRDTTPAKEILGWRPAGSSDNFDPDEL